MTDMRLCVVMPQTRPWREVAAEFTWAEEAGYDVAYVYDHLTHPTAAGGWLADGFTTLAAAAGVTSTIELGTLVASATLHSPVALARLAATVDDVSGGPLVPGLGGGSPPCGGAGSGPDRRSARPRTGARTRHPSRCTAASSTWSRACVRCWTVPRSGKASLV